MRDRPILRDVLNVGQVPGFIEAFAERDSQGKKGTDKKKGEPESKDHAAGII